MTKKYDIIYIDPPWQYGGNMLSGSHIKQHYPTMKDEDLIKLDIKNKFAAKDCLMFMWVTSPHLHCAIKVGEAWGFKYKTVGFCWEKIRTNCGFYTLSSVELCLIFKTGKIPSPRGSRTIRQFLQEKPREHSRKPDEVRDRIVQMFPTQKKIEIFARQKFKGWDNRGNEVNKFK